MLYLAKYIFMAEVESPIQKTPELKEGEIKVTPDIIENKNKIVQEEDWTTKLSKKRAAKNAEKKAVEESQAQQPSENQAENTETVNVETPVVEGEKKAEEPKVEKTGKKKFKKFWDKTQTPAEGETVITPTAAAKEQIKLPKEIEDELFSLRSIVNKPAVKMVLKAEASTKKDFVSYYDELKSRDPYKMSYDAIYKMQLEDQGLNETEITRKSEKFAEMDEDDQLDRIASFRKTLKDRFDQELNENTPIFEQPEPMVDDKALAETAKSFENKEIFGIMATPQMVKETYDYFNNSPLINIKDGKFDPQDLFTKTFLIKNFELIVNEAYEGGFNDGLEKLEQEVTQPLSTQIGSHQSQPRKVTSDTQKRIDSLKGSLPKIGSPTQ